MLAGRLAVLVTSLVLSLTVGSTTASAGRVFVCTGDSPSCQSASGAVPPAVWQAPTLAACLLTGSYVLSPTSHDGLFICWPGTSSEPPGYFGFDAVRYETGDLGTQQGQEVAGVGERRDGGCDSAYTRVRIV